MTADTHVPRIWDGTQHIDLPYQSGLPSAGTVAGVSAGDLVAGEAVAVAQAKAYVDAQLGNYAPLAIYAASPDLIASGTITRSTTGAATSFAVVWPDGATGTFTGTESTSFPGAIDSYTVTHVLAGTATKTYTQPALTRDASGSVTSRPTITVA